MFGYTAFQEATFDVLKFSLIVRLRGHKQKNKHGHSSFFVCVLSLAAKLNFNISNAELFICCKAITGLCKNVFFTYNSISSPVYVTRKSREICVRTLAFSCLLTFKAFGTTSTTFTVLAKNLPLNLT